MKKYNFILPIEVRTSTEGKTPEYIVKGYAAVPNAPEIYDHVRTRSGKITEIKKSVFTENAIQSMNRQAKSKKIFVDAEHKTAASLNVKHILNQITDDVDAKNALLKEIDMTELPLAKVNEISIDELGRLVVDTRLNPYFREVNQTYFDAIWNSIKEGYINGMSLNFVPKEVRNIDGVAFINDVDLLGVSYTGNPSSTGTQIFEVAVRAATETILEERKMEEIERKQKEIEAREKIVVDKERQMKETEERRKSEEIQRQIDEQKKANEELKKELEKNKHDDIQRKGIVPPDNRGETPTYDWESQEKIRDMFNKRIITNKNPHGDLSLGHILALDTEGFAQARNDYIRSQLPRGATLGRQTDMTARTVSK